MWKPTPWPLHLGRARFLLPTPGQVGLLRTGLRWQEQTVEAKKLRDDLWLGSDSNRLPADYETAALTS